MSLGEIAGYTASVLVFATFYMKTMMRLRIVGIVSNVAFITYALFEGLLPILILHASLLPLNIVRLREFTRMIERTRKVSRGEVSIESLLPFMAARRAEAGEVLFRKGDHSAEMFYVGEGHVSLPEIGKTLGPGATLGEIGLFSEHRVRTTSAVCETACELLSISEDRFLQLYNQNPRFGFHIVRVITSRLIENYDSLAQQVAGGRDDEEAAAEDGIVSDPVDKLDENRAAPAAPAQDFGRRRRMGLLRTATVFTVFLAILAAGLWAAPYVRSLVVRDAVVTTWTNLATAPIEGTVQYVGAALDSRIGADGVIAEISNNHQSRAEIDGAKVHVDRAHAYVRELTAHLEELKALDAERAEAKARYANQFRGQLDADIGNMEAEIATAQAQLGILKKIEERSQRLAERGTIAQNDADEATLRVSTLQVRLAKMESDISAARVRRSAADTGIFLTEAGRDPNWVFDWRMDLKVAKKSARLNLHQAEADLGIAEAALVAAKADFDRQSRSVVTVPPGAIVWRRRVSSGATVRAGDPVAEWIDCSILKVVVPVLTLELPLIKRGMSAEVLLDGETEVRRGTVILIRGSSSIFDRSDLVAVPVDRHGHAAEVIIDIKDQHADFAACPVGRSAYVNFPDVGTLDIAAAWLRL